MKMRKRPLIIISAALLPVLIMCAACVYLGDADINGFSGVWGIINLDAEETYIGLTETPYQLLIRKSDSKGVFEDSFFDDWEDEGHPAMGVGTKDGQLYEYSMRSFTRSYLIVTLEKRP